MSVFAWSVRKKLRRVRREICSRLYRDTDPDPARSILVAGAGRSGTTWLADLVASQVRCRVMFEPFHPTLVPQYGDFNYYQYKDPEEDDQALQGFMSMVFTGRIRNRWVDREVETFRSERRLIKAVRACLMLQWIQNRFPEVPIVMLLRHPCAVVASRMKLSWWTDRDIAPFLEQPGLVAEHLALHLSFIRNAKTDEEKHAIVWCITNLVPLSQCRTGHLDVVYFEDLVEAPHAVIPPLFRHLSVAYDDSVFDYHKRPSTTSRKWSAAVKGKSPASAWRGGLDDAQVELVMGVVRRFGLDGLYSQDGRPTGALPAGAERLYEPPTAPTPGA